MDEEWQGLSFDQLFFGVRPTRALVRLGVSEQWHQAALRILEALSATWGGQGDAIAAAHEGNRLSPPILRAAELFDPDVWCAHVRTGRGLELEDPDRFKATLDRLASESLPPDQDAQMWRGLIEEQLRDQTIHDDDVTADLAEQGRLFRAPYWDRVESHEAMVVDGQLPTGLLVDRTALTPLPDEIHVVDASMHSLPIQVLAAMRWGRLAPSARDRLSDAHVRVVDAALSEGDVDRLLGGCWGARPDDGWSPADIRELLGGSQAIQST